MHYIASKRFTEFTIKHLKVAMYATAEVLGHQLYGNCIFNFMQCAKIVKILNFGQKVCKTYVHYSYIVYTDRRGHTHTHTHTHHSSW